MKTKQEALAKMDELSVTMDELKALVETLPDAKPVWESKILTNKGEKGFWMNSSGDIYKANFTKPTATSGQSFKDRESVTIHYKFLCLVKAMKDFIREAWNEHGELPDWKNCEQNKYCIGLYTNNVHLSEFSYSYKFLHFPTTESRNKFREKFSDDDIKLVLTMGVW